MLERRAGARLRGPQSTARAPRGGPRSPSRRAARNRGPLPLHVRLEARLRALGAHDGGWGVARERTERGVRPLPRNSRARGSRAGGRRPLPAPRGLGGGRRGHVGLSYAQQVRRWGGQVTSIWTAATAAAVARRACRWAARRASPAAASTAAAAVRCARICACSSTLGPAARGSAACAARGHARPLRRDPRATPPPRRRTAPRWRRLWGPRMEDVAHPRCARRGGRRAHAPQPLTRQAAKRGVVERRAGARRGGRP